MMHIYRALRDFVRGFGIFVLNLIHVMPCILWDHSPRDRPAGWELYCRRCGAWCRP
jgi:hypothetical protein